MLCVGIGRAICTPLDDSRGADITAAADCRVESRTNKLVVSGNFRQPSFPVRRGVSNYKPAFLRVPTAPPPPRRLLLPLFFRPPSDENALGDDDDGVTAAPAAADDDDDDDDNNNTSTTRSPPT